MEPTTIKVIVPTSKYCGQIMPVEATYEDEVFARDENGHVLRLHRTQVEVVHVQDWDNFLYVDGYITGSAWQAIQTFARNLPDCLLAGSGWTGEHGHMSIKFQIGTATQNLPALAAFVNDYNLIASKPEPVLF